MKNFDTIVIGGGQAGLTMSDFLQRRGIDHIVLERARIAERWRNERWASLRFQFPNWSLQLPGHSFGGSDPDDFAQHSEIRDFILGYSKQIAAPIREQTPVLRLQRLGLRYAVTTASGTLSARRIVIATGPFQAPRRPDFAANFPSSLYQVDACRYRSPDSLPAGAVLVVGSGASGYQIAEDLLAAGRKVYLSVSAHKRAPRRYRGKDCYWWFARMGRFEARREASALWKPPPSVIVTGVSDGHDVNVRQLAVGGLTALGSIASIADGKVALPPGLNHALDAADRAFVEFVAAADRQAEAFGIEHGPDHDDIRELLGATEPIDEIPALDLRANNITSVVWATGYRYAFDRVDLPVFDNLGNPLQERGVTALPGVYFLGLHWMHTFWSGLLSFVARDAEHIADHMAGFRISSSQARPCRSYPVS